MTPSSSFSHRALLAGMAAVLCYLALAASAHAATYKVTTTADSNDGSCTATVCSLRDAIGAANSGSDSDNTINLPAGDYQLTLGQQLEVSPGAGALTITGDSARHTTIDAQGNSRVFSVDQGADLALANLTVTGGEATDNLGGGGIYTDGSLTLTGVMVTGNTDPSVWGYSGAGGGLFADYGTQVTITDSTFSNNTAAGGGGALLGQGQSLAITNSTFADNTVDTSMPGAPSGAYGGAMEINGPTTITNSTIADNTLNTATGDTNGGGTAIDGGGGGEGFSGITLTNDIIADNTATGGVANSGKTNCDVGPQNFTGVNDDDDASCADGSADIHANPHLGLLTDNGGQTDTMSITAASPAFSAADTALAPNTDQRGYPRPGVSGHSADIGAYELQASPAASPIPTPTSTPTPTQTTPSPAPKVTTAPKSGHRPKAPKLTLTGRLTPNRLQLCEWMSSVGEREPVGCHPGHLHVHYKLNRRARVHIAAQRYYQGRWVLLPRSVTHTSRAGRSPFTTGQSFRGQLLAAGRYRFVLVATSGRLRSQTVRLPFTVRGVRMPAVAPVTG